MLAGDQTEVILVSGGDFAQTGLEVAMLFVLDSIVLDKHGVMPLAIVSIRPWSSVSFPNFAIELIRACGPFAACHWPCRPLSPFGRRYLGGVSFGPLGYRYFAV